MHAVISKAIAKERNIIKFIPGTIEEEKLKFE